MYLDERDLAESERRWGRPGEWEYRVETSGAELAFIRSTQKHGRAHDVTLMIHSSDPFPGQWAVIAKHGYPEGAFRPPSGGVNPGESIQDGARREGREETGLDIELERYVLRARVTFAPEPDGVEEPIEWVSHVFSARVVGGELEPEDRHEIREAAWLGRDDLLGPVREKLLRQDAAGIRYRVALHEAIFSEMDRAVAREGGGGVE